SPSARTSEKPRMALSGVRSSWDMLARNSLLWRLAASSSRLFSSISRKRRGVLVGRPGPGAERWGSSETSPGKCPRGFPDHGKAAEQLLLTDEGHREQSPISGVHEGATHSAFGWGC